MSGRDDLASQFLGGLRSLFRKASPAREPERAPGRASGAPSGTPPQPTSPTGGGRWQAAYEAQGAVKPTPTAKRDLPRATARLGGAATTRTLPATLTPEEKAEESKRRMALIVTYLKNPEALGELKDSRFLYKVITDERDYLMEVIAQRQARLKELCESWTGDPADETFLSARAELNDQIEGLKQKQAQMFMMLKKLTGVRGKTGGTGFLVMPANPEQGGKAEDSGESREGTPAR